VVDARGTMQYEWGESCDGWTVEQRYRLRMRYGETADADIVSSFVTWESKDGLRYRFNQKQNRTANSIRTFVARRGWRRPEAAVSPEFIKPKPQILKLAAGVLVPGARHTILLIDKAGEGENFCLSTGFDGATGRERGSGLSGDRNQGRRRSCGG